MKFFEKIFWKIASQQKNQEILCPYCWISLNEFPQRKKKCKNCWNSIFIRKSPWTNNQILTTEENAIKIDKEWNKIHFKSKWIASISEFTEFTEIDYEKERDLLNDKFWEVPNDSDIIWSIFNKILLKTGDSQVLKGIYYKMAIFLDEEGKDPFKMLQQVSKMNLVILKNSWVVSTVEILTCGNNSCESCEKLGGKVFNIDTALIELPIPCKTCTNKLHSNKYGFCRCTYIPVIDY